MLSRARTGKAAAAVACAGTLLITSCTTDSGGAGGTTDGEDQTHTDTIRTAWYEAPTTFDPVLTTTTDDYRALRLLFDTVIRRDLDGEFIPGLAHDWELTPEGVTLTIGEGHTCDDGTEITATVVADSLEYLADPVVGSVHTGGIFGDGDVAVTGDNDSGEVSIELNEPHTDLLSGLAVPPAGIICPAGLEDLEGLATGTLEGGYSGPYTLAESTQGVSYSFALREDYASWPEYSEPLEGIPAQTLEISLGGAEAVANQLITGEVDVAPVDADELARFEGDDSYDFEHAVTGEAYIMFNHTEDSPFADEEMRRALAQVVDREALRDITYPVGELIATLGDETMQCASTDFDLLEDNDLDAASEVLEGISVNVIGANVIGQNGAAAEYVGEQLRSVGADVSVSTSDVGSWVSQLYDEPETWDVTVYATVNNLGSISWGLGTVIGTGYSDGGRNIGYSENPEAADAFYAALTAETEEQMCEHYEVAQQAALEAVNFIPVSTVTQSIVIRDGFDVQIPGNREDFTTLRIVDQG